MYKKLLILAVLLISFQGFYIDSLGYSPYSVVGVVLMVGCAIFNIKNIPSIKLKYQRVAVFYALVIFWSILTLIVDGAALDLKRFFGYFFLLILSVALPLAFYNVNISSILAALIAFHAIFFLIQFTAFYVFSYDIDMVYTVTGNSQKGWGGSYDHPIFSNFRRLGGLYNEPGSYATFMAPAIAIFSGFISNSKKNMAIFFLGAISLVLTFSTFAAIFSMIIIMLSMRQSDFKIKLISLMVLVIGFIIVFPYLYERFFVGSLYGINSGLDFRVGFFEESLGYIFGGVQNFIFGVGNLSIDLSNKINVTAAVNDSTLLLLMFLSFGPIIASVLILLLLVPAMRNNIYSVAALVILLLSKASLAWIYTPFILYVIMHKNKYFNEAIKK